MSAPTQPAKQVRLLLVDDHGLFREGLSRLLADEPDMQIVAQCSSVEEVSRTLDITPAAAIDLMLLDYDLGEQTGFEALRAARTLGFCGRVLLVTAGMSSTEMARAHRQGASGVFLKHSPPSELLEAIRHVMQDRSWPDTASMAGLLSKANEVESRKDATVRTPQPLTARERAVLRGVFEGRANKEIASELLVSEGSVKAVLQQLFAKTGVRSRAQLVRIALENRYEYQLEID